MDVYGAADASNLKTAIDDLFMKKIQLSSDTYRDGMVCAASDGASVNTGESLIMRLVLMIP
jgi:hypothetical protein